MRDKPADQDGSNHDPGSHDGWTARTEPPPLFHGRTIAPDSGATGEAPGSIESRRGSILIAAALGLVLLLMFGVMAVDVSRYFQMKSQVQKIADGTALAVGLEMDRVRRPETIPRERMVAEAVRSIQTARGFSADVHEISANLSTGDVQFVQMPPDPPDQPDTFYRVGVNIKHAFDPLLVPRGILGDGWVALQAQAVAELRPVFSKHNLYDAVRPGDPRPELQYALYAGHNIKTEGVECFRVEGDLHSNAGAILLENIDGVRSDGVSVDCDGAQGLDLTGQLEAGDPDNVGASCDDPGCVRMSDNTGRIEGDILWARDFTASGNSIDHTGTNEQATVDQVDMSSPPAPGEPGAGYPSPVCVRQDTYTISDLSTETTPDGDPCGTIYVEGGSLTVSDPTIDRDYTFVADQHVLFQDTSDMTESDLFVFSRESYVKFENVTDAAINATIYAPDPDNGYFKWEGDLSEVNRATLRGGIVTRKRARIEKLDHFTLLYRDHTDRLPKSLRNRVKPNEIADYWQVHLIH